MLGIFSLLAVEMNPYSRKPFAISENKIMLLKIPAKILVSVYPIIDYKRESMAYLCLILSIYYLMY